MRHLVPVVFLALLSGCLTVQAATITVTSLLDGGPGTLRRAVHQANTNPGPDTIVFDPALTNLTIYLRTGVVQVTDDGTTINGDMIGDGKPHILIRLDPHAVAETGALSFSAVSNCHLRGLAVAGFPNNSAASFVDCDNCTVKGCHLGANLAGTHALKSNYHDLYVYRGHHNIIGGTARGDRNVFGCARYGLEIVDTHGNTILGNHFAVNRAGTAHLGNDARVCLSLVETAAGIGCQDNMIGGAGPARNLFGGAWFGISIDGPHTTGNQIIGNTFGLAADGRTDLQHPGGRHIYMASDTHENIIGAAGLGNVFVNSVTGVEFDSGAQNNQIRYNYFGCNVAGNSQRTLEVGVAFSSTAGYNLIGGASKAVANYFCAKQTASCQPVGVRAWYNTAGAGIRNNYFGVLPNGIECPYGDQTAGINCLSSSPVVRDNVIAACRWGITSGVAGTARVRGNTIRHCGIGVQALDNVTPNLGDVGAGNPGENAFIGNITHIHNQTANGIRAEGNTFGSKQLAVIEAHIYDQQDDPARGRVDFIPLKGGIIPTDLAGAGGIVSAAAVPTPLGAEVLMTLSAPATISLEILNVAGRTVARPVQAVAVPAGSHRLLWNRRTLTGSSAPAGRYLVRLRATNATGEAATALCPLLLGTAPVR